ncbi:MAG TPA: DUF2251 domain-containing protein [Dyadobacter sp.]|jgi:hypothetical protein|nr:DUF2251 domain-containing protein [Dyadobacter sp.]
MSSYKAQVIGFEQTFRIGEDAYFTSVAPETSFVVSFEDDTETGYFYAVAVGEQMRILDALHIYNVIDVIHRDKPCQIQIMWTEDGLVASLLINGYCQGLFDFSKQEGFCRNNFPESKGEWRQDGSRLLTDEGIAAIFSVQD